MRAAKAERAATFIKLVMGGLLSCCLLAPAHAAEVVRIALSNTNAPMSYTEKGEVGGMLREMLAALFSYVPAYRPEFHAYPWTRAQRMVEIGEMDLFLTFPSRSRQAYAYFTEQPVYIRDYGNLVFDAGGRNASRIAAAKSFADLKNLIFVSQEAVSWEVENVPAYIKRYEVNSPPSLMHMIFQRRRGDFFIMPEEQALHFARELGYEKQLGMKRVSFIPNSQVHFHIGVRKSHPEHKKLLAALEAAVQLPEFQARKKAIEAKYRGYILAETTQKRH